MLLFIVNKIGNIDFIDESKFSSFLNLENNFYIGNIIHGWILNIEKEEFIKKLPLLNGFINKYGFINEVILPVDSKLIKLQNVYDIEFHLEEIEKIPNKISEIKKYIESGKLLTNSKKEEFKQSLYNGIYLILQNIIKIYFIIYDAVKNKQDLKKIINSENILVEYKAQAKLLESTSTLNLERMINQLDFLIKQISIIADFYSKFLETYIK